MHVIVCTISHNNNADKNLDIAYDIRKYENKNKEKYIHVPTRFCAGRYSKKETTVLDKQRSHKMLYTSSNDVIVANSNCHICKKPSLPQASPGQVGSYKHTTVSGGNIDHQTVDTHGVCYQRKAVY